MNAMVKHFAVIALTSLISFPSTAAAPVVDESENFAMIDQQESKTNVQNSSGNAHQGLNDEEEIALARDDGNNSENSGLLNKVKGMQQDLQELRGQLEVQAHQIQELQKQQLAFYKDIDNRLGKVSTHPSSAASDPELNLNMAPAKNETNKKTSTPFHPTALQNNPADEQISYLAAYDLVKNKQFDEALQAMQSFVSYHPQGGYTANAHYWLGELYMVKKQYPQAIEHFETVLNKFPSSSKSAPSSLKIGYALAASGKESEAKKRLQQVVKNYPDSTTAQLAFAKLNALSAS